jgi:hypothetical protein
MHKFWFKPKAYGYGATPTTWEGWVVVAVYVAVLLVCVLALRAHEKTLWNFVAAGAAFAVVTAAMIWISAIKTHGPWQWHWGDTESRNAKIDGGR